MTEGLTNKDKAKIKARFTKKLKDERERDRWQPAGKRKLLTTQDLNKALTQALDNLSDIQNK